MAMKIKPLGDRILVKPLEAEEEKKGGIIIPDTAKEKPEKGEVLAVGNGKMMDNGQRVAPEVKVGEKVLFSKYGGTEIKIGLDNCIILHEEDIHGIITE